VLNGLGIVMERQGEHERARTLYEDGLQIMRELGDTRGIAVAFCNLGNTAERQGEYQRAKGLYEESVRLWRELGDRPGIAESLIGLGAVAAHQQQLERALQLLGAANTIATSIGVSPEPGDRERIQTVSQVAGGALSAEDYGAAWNQGAAMNMEDAIEYALDRHGAA
jgi:tetratricopeptide (TPR) repeat protein